PASRRHLGATPACPPDARAGTAGAAPPATHHAAAGGLLGTATVPGGDARPPAVDHPRHTHREEPPMTSLRALGRRQRQSDLDRAWRDVVALMPDHARTGGPTTGDPVWAIGVAEGVARAFARLLRCDDDTAYALAASGYPPRSPHRPAPPSCPPWTPRAETTPTRRGRARRPPSSGRFAPTWTRPARSSGCASPAPPWTPTRG